MYFYRIRNVPVDDLRTKPKVALIENKFHPERSTATAYIKFTDPSSVEKVKKNQRKNLYQ